MSTFRPPYYISTSTDSGATWGSTTTVSLARMSALRTALFLVWSLVRHPRSSVTFEARNYTLTVINTRERP